MVLVLLARLLSLATAVVASVPGATFLGNTTSSNHFTLLTRRPGSVLVGGRNAVYNLSLPGLHELGEEVGHSQGQEVIGVRYIYSTVIRHLSPVTNANSHSHRTSAC